MSVLRWRHGRTAAEAKRLMQQELATAGYADQVTWTDHTFAASVGFGAVLTIAGRVTESEAVLDTCGGALGVTALARITDLLHRLFPGGKV